MDSLSQLRDCLLRYNIFWHRCRGRRNEVFSLGFCLYFLWLFREEDILKVVIHFLILAYKRPHMRLDTSQQKVPTLSNLEKLVSKNNQKSKTLSTPDATLLAARSSYHTPSSKDFSWKLTFQQQESLSSFIHFQEPRLEEYYFKSISFTFTETQPNIVFSYFDLVY